MSSFIPSLNINFPNNYSEFVSTYLTIKSITIPFDALPEWLPNLKKLIRDWTVAQLTGNFKLAGIESMNFIYNFADQLGTWIIMLFGYIILRILTRLIPKKEVLTQKKVILFCRFAKIHEWRSSYEYNCIFRVILESFLQLCFCSILNIYNVKYILFLIAKTIIYSVR